MAGRIRRVLRLSPVEQARLVRVAMLRAAIEPALRAVPLPRLARMLGLRLGSSADPPAPPLRADALSDADRRAVRAADALTAGGHGERRCLRHALLAGHALRRHQPVLRLGAARRAGETVAHAWIELLGGRIDVDDATEYLPLRAARTDPERPQHEAEPARRRAENDADQRLAKEDPDRLLYEAVRDRRATQLATTIEGPPELVEYLARYRRWVVKLNLLLSAEARRAVAALEKAGIHATALLPEADQQIEPVIAVDDRERAITVLEDAGFVRAGSRFIRSELDAVIRVRQPDDRPDEAPGESFLGSFEPTPPAVVDAMLDLAEVGPDDVLVDLGSGDGRVLEAAQKRGARAIGYETDPVLADSSRAKGLSVHSLDATTADLSEATVVTLYVTLEAALRMQSKLKDFVARGGRVVAHHVDLGLWPCSGETVVDTGKVRRTIRMWAST